VLAFGLCGALLFIQGDAIMELLKLPYDFNVCKINSIKQLDLTQEFVFISKTDDEISLVCEASKTPSNITACEPGWKALKIAGILDFGMIGVIAKISNILAEAKIGIFVVSTFNTDYIFIKTESFDRAVEELIRESYNIRILSASVVECVFQ